MIHRLINIPKSNEDFEKEMNAIKEIVVNDGYNMTDVDRILKKNFKFPLDNTQKIQIQNTISPPK